MNDNYRDSTEFDDSYVHVSIGLIAECRECQDETGHCCKHSLQAAMSEGFSDEAVFSHYPCDRCGNVLAGSRYNAHGRRRTQEDVIDHFCVCETCVFEINGLEVGS